MYKTVQIVHEKPSKMILENLTGLKLNINKSGGLRLLHSTVYFNITFRMSDQVHSGKTSLNQVMILKNC